MATANIVALCVSGDARAAKGHSENKLIIVSSCCGGTTVVYQTPGSRSCEIFVRKLRDDYSYLFRR